MWRLGVVRVWRVRVGAGVEGEGWCRCGGWGLVQVWGVVWVWRVQVWRVRVGAGVEGGGGAALLLTISVWLR